MKKNLLFILTDDQRYNTIHALGNSEIITPNMDRLVRSGTAFTQAHIPGGTSGAICMPSRAMLHTGRSLFGLEGEGQNIPCEHKTLGEVFRGSGYETLGTGKWHNGPPAFTRSFSGGDNVFFGGMWDHWNVPTCKHDPTGEYDNVINFTANFPLRNDTTQVHCDKFHPGKHSSELLTDTAIRLLEERSSPEQPFFLYLAYLAPHDPRTMPERYKKMYNPEKLTLPTNFMTEHPFSFGVEDIRDEVLAAYPRSEKEIRVHLAEYYAMITHLDDEIGRLLSALEDSGELENTVVVLTGDNGLAVGSHGLMGKQNHYEHSVRVPLAFSGPGIPVGKTVDSYVYLLDIFPTLCEMFEIAVPDSVQGKSFCPLFQDPSLKIRNSLYFVYNELIRSTKDQRYKLVEYRNYAWKTQLFDLLEDPDELHDLAGETNYDDILQQLRRQLHTYRDEWESGLAHPYSQAFWNAAPPPGK